MKKILFILIQGREAVQSELAKIDLAIARESALPDSKDSPSIPLLLKGRDRTQLQLDVLDNAIASVQMIDAGKLPQDSQEAKVKSVIPGQYMGMKLSTATQAYLCERGRGPAAVATICRDLITGGFQIVQSRALGANRGKLRDPDTRDLRIMAAQNNRKRFLYNSVTDEISLSPAPGNDTSWRVPRPSTDRPTA